MKINKILKITATALAITSAFFIGRATTTPKIPEGYIKLEKAIPLDDVACWHIDEYNYIEIELKDVTHQLDDWKNASYDNILMNIPIE